MPSQVLALHRVSRRQYDLAGVRTGNVRDQLLRSTVVVNALRREALIGQGSPLLVYGGGPAGMNAAMLAATYHANVTVVERTKFLFSTIRQAWWRRIDATEYDWPHNHWPTGIFPVRGKIPLMQTTTSDGVALAEGWRLGWEDFKRTRNGRNGFGTVDVIHELDAVGLHPEDTPALLKVTGRWSPGSLAQESRWFGALLSCIGHGDEQVTDNSGNGYWGGYAGPRFWTDSDGIAPDRPLPAGVSDVLISGAGDGGMQDFQRVLTSRCGKELLDKVVLAARTYPSSPFPIVLPEGLEKWLLSADEAGRRAFGWAPDRDGAPRALKKWHYDFEEPIKGLVRSWPGELAAHVAATLFRKEVLDQKLSVEWVMREQTPGYAYALNRYLAILLQSLAERIKALVSVHPGSTISGITGVDHECRSAATCLGKKHKVLIDRPNKRPIPRDADLIIIRHGLEPRPLLLSGRNPVPEQIVPSTYLDNTRSVD